MHQVRAFAAQRLKWQTAALKWAVIPAAVIMGILLVCSIYAENLQLINIFFCGFIVNMINIAGILMTNKTYRAILALETVSHRK